MALGENMHGTSVGASLVDGGGRKSFNITRVPLLPSTTLSTIA
jgi:hypothetical protein